MVDSVQGASSQSVVSPTKAEVKKPDPPSKQSAQVAPAAADHDGDNDGSSTIDIRA